MPTTDDALLARWIHSGDADAFTRLIRHHSAMVYGVCRRIVGDRGLAEDLTQECFLKLAQRRASPPGRVAAWLHRVAANGALSALRARRDPVADDAEPQPSPADLASWRELEEHVDAAIAGLGDEERAAVVEHFLEGRTHEEIAHTHGVSRRAVGYRIERGLDRVRAALRRAGVRVERAALASWLAELPAVPVPAPVLASLGKIALAGPAPVLATAGVSKAFVAGVCTLLIGGAVWGGISMAGSRGTGEQAARAATPSTVAAADRDRGVAGTGSPPAAAAAAGSAGGGERRAVTAPPTTGVVVSVAGAPVPGAEVVAVAAGADGRLPPFDFAASISPRGRRVVADARGRFSIARDDPASPVLLSAFREGYASQRRWLDPAAEPAAGRDVVIELAPGRTLAGRLLGPDGAPVGGAVVAVIECWRVDDFVAGSGLALTDRRGEFRVGVAADSTACNLHASSAAYGSDLFLEVSTVEFADLRWRARSSLRGRVLGMTAELAGALEVEVRATVPDPPVPVILSGLRPAVTARGPVGADGTYRVDGLQPGLQTEAWLVRRSPGGGGPGAPRTRLSTPDSPFVPAPGAVVEHDFELLAPIVLRGRVTTAGSGRPVPGVTIAVERDGRALFDVRAETADDGSFELRSVAGPGSYRIGAQPRIAPRGALESFAVTRRIAAGEIVELDLVLPAPTVLPFRVVDAGGQPVQGVQLDVGITAASGQRMTFGESRVLDADGRGRLEVFGDVAALRLAVQRFPHGPRRVHALEPVAVGAELAELELALPVACTMLATVRDDAGAPIADTAVTVVVRYGDGGTDEFACHTDREGRFERVDACRAQRVIVDIAAGTGLRASVPAALPDAAGRIDLGVVTVR